MIFADTSFWVALRMRRDRNHQAATRLFEEHRAAALLPTTLGRAGPGRS